MSPMKEPQLKLLWAKDCATTYSFQVEGDFGWALCTVNDTTGELGIVSDWGSWSYLWSPKQDHLGAASLTHFIGERNSVEYIKDKLLKRYGQVFSSEATTTHLQKMIIERRLEDGRSQNDRAPLYGVCPDKNFRGRKYLTKDSAREIWNELESLASDILGNDDSAETLYIERASQIDDIDDVCEEIWDEIQHVESNDAKVLKGTILPALVAACAERVRTDPRYIMLKDEFVAMRAAKAAAAREAAAP